MPTRTRLAIAFMAACIAATAVYPVLRIAAWLVFHEPDPALVIYSAHAGYYWRAQIASYFGVTLGFAAWLRPDATARALAPGVVIAASALILQSLFVP